MAPRATRVTKKPAKKGSAVKPKSAAGKAMKVVMKRPAATKAIKVAMKRASSTKAMKVAMKRAPPSKAMKKMKRTATKQMKLPAKKRASTDPISKDVEVVKRGRGRARKETSQAVPEELKNLKAFIVNLERRPDRMERVAKMLKKETPWLEFEQFKASDGTINPIPVSEVAEVWNTKRNAEYADYYEWVKEDGQAWMWAADAENECDNYRFTEDQMGEEEHEEWSYISHAPKYGNGYVNPRTATVENLLEEPNKTFKVRLELARRCLEPGEQQRMSGGERGCAHSHLRLWRLAAERSQPTLVLEDDVHFGFERSADMGTSSGKVFTERLAGALKNIPHDFDVLYLGWSGWRGGHFKKFKEADETLGNEAKDFFRKAEYVWTTVAYVLTQAGAKKLLAAASAPVLDQPVDNFMAWEASQGRLNAYVALDEGDDDGTWAGGIVDQFDFQGDSDIKKSDGGVQGDDAKDFAVAGSA